RSVLLFFAPSFVLHVLPPFPTRRSSDLIAGLPLLTMPIFMADILPKRPLAKRLHKVVFPGNPFSLSPSVVFYTLRKKGRILLSRSEEHTSELQSRENLVCRLLLEKKKNG